jgi:hypothetical protein
MYFAEFTKDNKVFQKFGHTGHNDAMIRLNILAAAYHNDITKCQGAEEAFKCMYPKNFWLEEKISGITECVVLDQSTRNSVIQAVRKLNTKFKEECFGNQDSA